MNLADEANARNLKDFLLLYNGLTEQCFHQCISQFYGKDISRDENTCVEHCTDRYVSFNQRLMKVFMEHQSLRQKAAAAQ